MVEKKIEKKIEKNRIRIEMASPTVEVESSTESLKVVYKIADDIVLKILKGREKDNKRRSDIASTAIR